MRYTMPIALIALFAIPAAANAQDCRPVFVNSDQSLMINGTAIEPGGEATRDFEIRVQNQAAGSPGSSSGLPGAPGVGSCGATIRVARVGAIPGPDFPPYVIRAPGNGQVEILPDPASGGTANSDVYISNLSSAPQEQIVSFQMGVPTEWGVRAGTYTDQLQLVLIDESGTVADRSALTATIIIPSAVSLRLVGAVLGDGSSGPARIDLGNLSSSTETRSDPFGARIFSTAPYSIKFDSVNLGRLMHEQGGEEIPYRLFFDGALVDLGGNYEVSYLDNTPRDGDKISMSIVVQPVVALAGQYSDRITMTMTAM